MTLISNSNAELSATFDTDTYHYRPNDIITWATAKGRRCDECAALQHETRGQYVPRRVARSRTITGPNTLLLCHLHADAWKARDDRMRG